MLCLVPLIRYRELRCSSVKLEGRLRNGRSALVQLYGEIVEWMMDLENSANDFLEERLTCGYVCGTHSDELEGFEFSFYCERSTVA
jgi:hypothetical protein